MKPVIIGNCVLYNEDCRFILPTLGKVDSVVTDPPYGTQVVEWDISVDGKILSDIARLSAGYSVFFYSNTRLAHILNALKAVGKETWVAVWHKLNAIGFERKFAPQWVPIVVAYDKRASFWGKDLCACPIVPQDIDHPTPKQLGIVEWCVSCASKPGDVVLDPFMGSGTTLVACAKLGRRGIGIEINKRYFDIACSRIEAAYAQPDMFVAAPEQQPEQLSCL